MPAESLFSVSALLKGIWRRRRRISFVSAASYAIFVLTFALQVLTARLLGAEALGMYSATLALVALAEAPLIIRGAELATRKLGEIWNGGEDVANLQSVASAIVRHDMALYTFSFMVLAALAWTFHGAFDADPALLTILALTIPAQAGYGVFKTYFIIFNKVSEMVQYELIYAVVLFAVNLIGLLLGGMYGLAVSMVVASIAKTLLAYWLTRSYVPASVGPTHRPPTLMELTRESGYPAVRNLFSNGLNHIDIVLLGLVQKPEIVALYKVGKSIASLPIKIGFPVWHYLQPTLVEAIQKGDSRKKVRVILAGSAVLAGVFLALLPPVLLAGEPLLVFFYGEAYRGAFEHFLILVVGVWALQGVTGWFKLWMVVAKSQSYGIKVYAAAFLATILLGAAFGSASPTAMSYVVTFVSLAVSVVAFVKVLRT